jgi:ATP-binding cassette, subfamily B, bacterial PglK
MLEKYRKIFALLNSRERKRFYLVMIIMVFVSFAEVLGISTLLLLLNVFSDPEKINTNMYLSWLYQNFHFTKVFSFQIFLSGLVFAVVMIGLMIKAGGNYVIIRFSAMRGSTLSVRLLEAYLHQPYVWFLERNSSEISKNVLGEVNTLVTNMLIPSLQMLSNVMMAASIVAFLVIVDPLVAVVAALCLGGGYLLIYVRLRKRLSKLGKSLLAANKSRYQMAQEATGGAKEVKLLGLEHVYVDRFRGPARRFARATALSRLMGQMPRYALEAMTFAVLLVVILIMLFRNGGDLTAAVPTLGIFAISVMRLLPAMQNIYRSVVSMQSGTPVLDMIYEDYIGARSNDNLRPVKTSVGDKMQLGQKLELRDISFAYPNAERSSIDGLSLTVAANNKVGIVGGTGAGKTTLVDIILGLLSPDKGSILVDGQALSRQNLQAWRRSLGYVPQTIYLTDASIAENIAFGIPPGDIDMDAVERAARTAALHDFVQQELPSGYKTIVGERGVRLSGGQRQRIGIARALYHDPDLLIMDEATSALDNLTERAIMDAVQNIGDQKTIIMIAHRLTTVRACDKIVLLQHGKIAASGTYDELVDQNETFRRMAGE